MKSKNTAAFLFALGTYFLFGVTLQAETQLVVPLTSTKFNPPSAHSSIDWNKLADFIQTDWTSNLSVVEGFDEDIVVSGRPGKSKEHKSDREDPERPENGNNAASILVLFKHLGEQKYAVAAFHQDESATPFAKHIVDFKSPRSFGGFMYISARGGDGGDLNFWNLIETQKKHEVPEPSNGGNGGNITIVGLDSESKTLLSKVFIRRKTRDFSNRPEDGEEGAKVAIQNFGGVPGRLRSDFFGKTEKEGSYGTEGQIEFVDGSHLLLRKKVLEIFQNIRTSIVQSCFR